MYHFCPKCGGSLGNRYVDGDKHERLVCANCGFIFYQNSKPCASALLEKDGRVMLVRRAVEPYKGCWDIPGGFLENGEHPEDGVVRELLEETGLTIEPTEILGIFMDIYAYGDGGDHTLNFFYTARIASGEPTPASDVDAIGWFGPHEIPENVAFACCRQALDAWIQQRSQT